MARSPSRRRWWMRPPFWEKELAGGARHEADLGEPARRLAGARAAGQARNLDRPEREPGRRRLGAGGHLAGGHRSAAVGGGAEGGGGFGIGVAPASAGPGAGGQLEPGGTMDGGVRPGRAGGVAPGGGAVPGGGGVVTGGVAGAGSVIPGGVAGPPGRAGGVDGTGAGPGSRPAAHRIPAGEGREGGRHRAKKARRDPTARLGFMYSSSQRKRPRTGPFLSRKRRGGYRRRRLTSPRSGGPSAGVGWKTRRLSRRRRGS